MSGKPINPKQVKLYMTARNKGKTQATAAAKADISERTGRRIEKEELQPGNHKRHWRTRPDPFSAVWEDEIVPLLKKAPKLTPITLFEKLQKDHPGDYSDSKLRTFQRRVKEWRSLHGSEKEVMFRQHNEAGRMGISDFTKLKKVLITILGQPFTHILYHFRLAFSGWCSVKVIHGGESYAALAEGLQDALWRLGGTPQEHRSDSLSAGYRNLTKAASADVTQRYQQFCRHYGMEPTRNNRGKGHENGAIESPHGHLKKRIQQAILLRESSDFDSVAAYEQFISAITYDINARKEDKIEIERQHLQLLPLQRTADYTEQVVRVSTSSTIQVKRVLYTVPSRLIGESLRVHIYDNRLDLYLGATHTVTLPRAFASDHKHRARQVDYRHVIASLERKPQAFRYSQIRDDLLPNEEYAAVWAWLDKEMEARKACKTIVGILALAHRADCEKQLGDYLQTLMSKQELPSLYALQQRFEKRESTIPAVKVKQPPVASYNVLLSSSQEVH
ncbi:MAG: IS21 family transposase [Desulfobacterales bacterium]